jgi:hypothetical protein
MKKNENIAISLQVQRGKESKALFLCVQFDKTAPNFAIDNDSITWYPTCDEIDFIADAFHLIGESKDKEKTIEEKDALEPSPEIKSVEPSIRSSEIRIPPLSDDAVIEITANSEVAHSKGNDVDEKIFVQADDKKIDEILKRRKAKIEKEYAIESEEKSIMDRMLKQKRKKNE